MESNLDSTDSSLSQIEIDLILGFSERNKSENVIYFLLNDLNIIIEKTEVLENDPLFSTGIPTRKNDKWPGLLKGIPCSPGITTAPCVRDINEARDKILIAHHLNVRDIKSLEGVRGIILENANLLSHTGVLAREKKIPCIMGVKESGLIIEGSIIKIDGSTGLIVPG